MPPAFSVVIPLYNKSREIHRAIQSVLNQTEQSFEVIVVDDGSTDNGAEIARGLSDSRIRMITQENQGLAAARNRGMVEAGSEIVAFLDADDEWLPQHLAELRILTSIQPAAGLFFTAYLLDRGRGWRRHIRVPRVYLKREAGGVIDYLSLPPGKILPSGAAVRKVAAIEVGGFRKMFGEDIDLWLRLGALYPVAYSAKATTIWHLDADNRLCVAQTESRASHVPGSLLPSLDFIASHDHGSQRKLAAEIYIRRRERAAIYATLLNGDTQQAGVLYAWWKTTFLQRDRVIERLLRIPVSILHMSGRIRYGALKCWSAIGYLLNGLARKL